MTASTTKSKASAVKKAEKAKHKAEKIFHPESRKAGQLQREALRKHKLSQQVAKRGQKQKIQANRYAFFLRELPPDVPSLTLVELHDLIKNVWLTKYDLALQEERALRRKGRPKSSREDQLEELKKEEAEEYRTGLELPDLLDAHNVGLFRQWDGIDVNYLHVIRFIRICGEFPDIVHVARLGRDKDVPPANVDQAVAVENNMDIDVEKKSITELGRLGSTMLGMDDIPFQ
ncbi:hypothetical protein FRC17_008827 [Serendipita sp. 399]|nr:hypothetical protein FRC17_008827 [Serendipita sp. 399]